MRKSPPRPEMPLRPKDKERWLWIVRAQAGKRFPFIALCDQLYQVHVHWRPELGRGKPCFGKEECEDCGPTAVRIWQGYLSGASLDLSKRFIVEVTLFCAQQMHEAGLLAGSLYGKELVFERQEKQKSKNGKVCLVEWSDCRRISPPPRIDPEKSLLRMWGWNEEHEALIRAKVAAARGDAEAVLRKKCEEAA